MHSLSAYHKIDLLIYLGSQNETSSRTWALPASDLTSRNLSLVRVSRKSSKSTGYLTARKRREAIGQCGFRLMANELDCLKHFNIYNFLIYLLGWRLVKIVDFRAIPQLGCSLLGSKISLCLCHELKAKDVVTCYQKGKEVK
jgi:hypothetical protein